MKQKRIPLKGLKNFGPVTFAEFDSMGILYLDQIEKLGFEDTCRRWVQYYPERLNANAFLGIACTLDRVVWTKATAVHRSMARSLVSFMRKELGLPQAKRSAKKSKVRW